MNSWRRPVGALFFAGLACPLILLTQARLPLPSPYVDPNPKPYSSQFVKFLSIGYWPAVSDWMWIQTLQMIGSATHPQESKPAAVAFYNLATDLDPRFFDLYELASAHMGFFYQDPEQAIRFLEKGIRFDHPSWKRTFFLYINLAYYYGHGLNDWPKAKESYLKAASSPGSPAYLHRMKTWLDESGSEKELARRVLTALISSTQNEILKQEYQKKLNEL